MTYKNQQNSNHLPPRTLHWLIGKIFENLRLSLREPHSQKLKAVENLELKFFFVLKKNLLLIFHLK